MNRFTGDRLNIGLGEYIRYYVQVANIFKLEEPPAIHLDARVFSDPDRGDLGRHTGRHHKIIARVVAHQEFGSWMRNARRTFANVFINWRGDPMLPAVVFCRSGKHQGFAASERLKGVLSRVEGWSYPPTIHISIDIEGAGCRCENCELGRQTCNIIQSTISFAVSALSDTA